MPSEGNSCAEYGPYVVLCRVWFYASVRGSLFVIVIKDTPHVCFSLDDVFYLYFFFEKVTKHEMIRIIR